MIIDESAEIRDQWKREEGRGGEGERGRGAEGAGGGGFEN